MKFLATISLVVCTAAFAEFKEQPVAYQLGETSFEGRLIYSSEFDSSKPQPSIVLFPNWKGPTEAAFEKARKIAGDDFVVFVADMYGTEIRPTNAGEAGKAAGTVRADRDMMRERAQKAIDVFHSKTAKHPIDPNNTIAIGFCFGGGNVLELARSGTESVKGVVSFHGDLMSPTLGGDSENVKIPSLILHGADDPYVPQEHVQAFISAMQEAQVDDWNLVQFSGTVHSFTDPYATSEGAHYNERTTERAFEMMEDFIDEWLELED